VGYLVGGVDADDLKTNRYAFAIERKSHPVKGHVPTSDPLVDHSNGVTWRL
jgi:hypothetical protein